MEKFKNNLLSRDELKGILGGLENNNDPNECPEGTHKFTCYWGTNWRTYCVDDSMNNPDCSDPYPGWPPVPGDGIPGPL